MINMYMSRFILIILGLFLLIVLIMNAFNDYNTNSTLEEAFTPFLRQQYRQAYRGLRTRLRDNRKKASSYLNRIAGKYGLGF